MPSGSTPGFWLSPDGSARPAEWWNKVSWRSALALMAAAYIFFFALLLLKGCPIRKTPQFEVQPADQEFQSIFCDQLEHLRWLIPDSSFPVRMNPWGKDCQGNLQPSNAAAERIVVARLECGASVGTESHIKDGVRWIALCPTRLDWTSLAHEYLHQLRGHVCIPWRNDFFNVLADFPVEAEMALRAVWRLPLIGISILIAGLLIYGLQKFGRTIWEPRRDQ
jgi:hypothetical protein